MAAPDFHLTKAEQDQWGIRYDAGALRVRSTLPNCCGAAGGIAFGLFWVVVSFGTVGAFGPVGVVFPAVGLALIAWCVSIVVGVVLTTADGLAVRALRVRRFPWNQVDDFRLVDRPRWLMGWNQEIVQVVLHSGKRIRLWPTFGNKSRVLPYGGPSAARVKRDVLLRYREMYTNP